MVSPPRRSPVPKAYRFVVRVSGRALPSVDKALRLRCTINAADHSVVGVSALVVHLGTAAECDHHLELVHEPAAADAAPPQYFELIASLAATADPATRLHGVFPACGGDDGAEYRIAGMMDPEQGHVLLPPIVLGAG